VARGPEPETLDHRASRRRVRDPINSLKDRQRMMAPHEDLKPKQLEAATHLAKGMSGRETAKIIGVAAETISRWKQDRPFVVYLNQLKRAAVRDARDSLRILSAKAVGTVKKLLNSPSDAIRLQTAKYIIDAMLVDQKSAQQGIEPTEKESILFGSFHA
jgi:transcriptional regulator with XRE-family HTH domain